MLSRSLKKIAGLLAVSLVFTLSACASPEADEARASQLSVLDTEELGEILVDGEGNVLYMFVPDDQKTVTCTFTCASNWPPLITPVKELPTAGEGVDSDLIGAMPATDPWDIVTYGGWPLYRYAADKEPGQHRGHATVLNGGEWYVMQPDGQPLRSDSGR